MKRFYFSLIRSFFIIQTFLFILTFETNAQSFEWAKGITGSDYNSGNSIKVDIDGNSYITGQFIGTANFNDNIHLTSFGGYDIFIAKFDPNGNCLWAKQAGGYRDDYGYGISLDSKGNIYVTGSFIYTAIFDTIQLINYSINSATSDIFVAKYDPNGNCLWAKQAGGSLWDFGSSISVDINGNSYLVGTFMGPAIFGIFQLNGFLNSDIFIAKYDPDGNCLWAKQAGGNMWDYGLDISIDPNGNSYITGEIQDTTYFENLQLFGFGGFLAKYDSKGNCLWAKAALGVSGEAISVDKNDNIYFTGWFDYTATFDTIQINGYITYPSNQNIFIAKYDVNGNCLWAKGSGGPKDDVGAGIAVDINGNCYVSGYFTGSITFGTITISSVNSQDLFIAKYDPKGNCLWATHAGGRGSTSGFAITNNAGGSIFCTGSILYGPANFDSIKLPGSCAFISKLSDEATPVELSSFSYKIINNSVNLIWTTQTETNNNRFEIERKNSHTYWNKIGELKGAGTSTLSKQYSFVDKPLLNGEYYYRLKQIDYSGQYKYSKDLEVNIITKLKSFSLENNFPNPFNSNTIIRYSLPSDSYIKLTIYNELGQILRVLIAEEKVAGYYEVNFNATTLPSGIYYYSVLANSKDGKQNYTSTKKMILLK